MVSKELIAEIKRIIGHPVEYEPVNGKIVFDGKQYSIRIPQKLIKMFEIDHKKDIFEFSIIPPDEDHKELRLTGKLVIMDE